MKSLNLSKPEIYFLPILVIIFFITYHYYDFYVNGYTAINRFISQPYSVQQYTEIQKQHPYYEIYSLAKLYKNSDKEIVFLMSKQGPATYDYTSSILLKKNKYLSEIGLMIHYFFYPRIISIYTVQELMEKKPPKGSIIISDISLKKLNVSSSEYISIPITKKQYQVLNRWKEEDYFIYEVVN